MHIAKQFLASILVLAALCLASPLRAEEVFYLKDGSSAMIVEKRFVVYPPGSKRMIAPPGKYETRDGRYTIVVTGKAVKVTRNESPRIN